MFSSWKKGPHANIEIHKPAYKKYIEKSGFQVLAAILLLVVAVVAFKYFVRADGPQIILNTLTLNKGSLDVVKRSTLITQTDELVRDTGNRKISGDWKELSACVASGCKNNQYFNFIITVTENQNVPNSDLILNLFRTYKYWNSAEDIVDFSKALTEVNNAVDSLGSRALTKAWGEIVKCNGQCSNSDELYFEMIRAIVLESAQE